MVLHRSKNKNSEEKEILNKYLVFVIVITIVDKLKANE